METQLTYALLGPLEVAGHGRTVPVRAGKQRSLLATLLVSPNRLVPVDELIERLWGQHPPSTARATLATYVMRLRRTLADPVPVTASPPAASGSYGGPIRTRPEGYLLEAPPDHTDLGRFGQLLAEAEGQTHAPELVLGTLTEALALWRGPALVDIPSESLHRDVAPRLEEQRLHALERRIDAGLALGRHAELVGELTAMTTEHQLRERFWQQLMLALYRSHRQPDALEAYARLRALLVGEMGLEPSVEIRYLHQRMLAEDPDLHRPEAVQTPSAPVAAESVLPAPWVTLCQLPPDIPDFVGRDDVIDEVASRLRAGPDETAVPVVVLTGTPGTGKSTLAVHVAHRVRPEFPDGQLFVRLTRADGTARNPSHVLDELLTASGVSRDALPDGLDARAAAFRARVADRSVLLVLDDAPTASQVMALLPGTPGCAVLVTGRRLLSGIPGSWGIRLAPFGRDDALALLSRLVRPDRMSREPEAAGAIVDACGGLPLALRIVGARLAARPSAELAALAARLADEQRRLDELRTGDLEVRAGLALSCSALSPEAELAFRRLGLLGAIDVASWTVGVLADHPDGELLVEELAGASLLAETGRDPTGEPRYRPHDLLALYAAELARADDPDVNRAALRRLVDALLTLADAAYAHLPALSFDEAPVDPVHPSTVLPAATVARLTGNGEAWLLAEQLQLDWAIRRCVDAGWYADAALLADRAVSRLDIQLPHHQVVELLDLVRAAALAAGDERIAWRAAWQRSMQAATRGVTEEVLDTLAASVEAFERLGSHLDLAYSLAALAHFRDVQDAPGEALALAERAVGAARASGDRRGYASAIRELASLLARHDRYAEAVPMLSEALAIARELGGPVDEALVLHRLAMHALDNGDLDRAGEAARTSLEVVAGVPDHRARAYAAAMAARVASARGEGAEALVLAERARREFGKLGDRFGEVAAIASLAEAYLELGRAADVVPLVNDTLPAYAGVGATRHEERLRRARLAALEALEGPH